KKGERLDKIRKRINEAKNAIAQALDAAEVTKVALAEILTIRKESANRESAALAPNEFRKAEGKYKEAILKAEAGDIRSAKKKADEAMRAYREMTIAALFKGPIKTAEDQLKKGRAKVSRQTYKTAERDLKTLKKSVQGAKKQKFNPAEYEAKIRAQIDGITSVIQAVPVTAQLSQGAYTIQQTSTGRYVDAYESSKKDYSLVTRTAQNSDTQRWILTPLGNNTYTIQQQSSGRYVDAYESSKKDHSLVTRTAQNNDTQRWILRKRAFRPRFTLPITLRASPYRGDVGEKWDTKHNFVDYSTTYHFKWSYRGAAISNIVYQVSGPSGAPLKTQAVHTIDSGQTSVFTISMNSLPKRDAYSVRLQPVDTNGEAVGLPSNAAVLTYKPTTPVPFNFAQFDVDDVQRQWDAPGVVGAVLCPSGQMFEFASGVRRYGSTVKVQPGDLWHIGSDTKAMTAVLIGKLVDEDLLEWDESIWDLTYGPKNLFPEIKSAASKLHERFQNVMIEHLASHRSGMVITGDEDAPTRKLDNYREFPRNFRWETVEKLLTRDHTGVIGEWRYGHGNYMLLAVIIERLKGKPYEEVMQEELFGPAGMSTARFGMPTDMALPEPSGWVPGTTNPWVLDPDEALAVNTTAQPNGHTLSNGSVVVDNLALPPVWNSAGGVYLSMEDWLRFLLIHTNGKSGSFSLSAATLAKLQSPYMLPDRMTGPWDEVPEDQDDPAYGFGWRISDGSLGKRLTHDGSYGRFYATARVYPDKRFAVVSVSNLQRGETNKAAAGVMAAFLERAKTECPTVPPFKLRFRRKTGTRDK
ncbi:MAG: serine hydrolase, partial [Calditrichaeota bacterium]|nr:serine hydrolase [Calditrichota bacterium]